MQKMFLYINNPKASMKPYTTAYIKDLVSKARGPYFAIPENGAAVYRAPEWFYCCVFKPQSGGAYIGWKAKSAVRIHAVSDNQDDPASLEGETFVLYSAKTNKAVTQIKFDANGKGGIYRITPGEYYLKEKATAEGYFPYGTAKISVTTKKAKVTKKIIKMKQKPYMGTLNVQLKPSVQEAAASFEGEAFDVFSAKDDSLVTTLSFDAAGKAQADLEVGNYYLVEKSTAPGFAPYGDNHVDVSVAKDSASNILIELAIVQVN